MLIIIPNIFNTKSSNNLYISRASLIYIMSTLKTVDRLINIKVSSTNHEFLYSICKKKDETFNDAVTKIIEVAKPFFKKERQLNDK